MLKGAARIVPNHSAFGKRNQSEPGKRPLRLFEITRMLVRLNHVASFGQTIFVADAYRDNGKRFIVTADEKLRAFLELQRVTRESFRSPNAE
jgi:hypothetical protein